MFLSKHSSLSDNNFLVLIVIETNCVIDTEVTSSLSKLWKRVVELTGIFAKFSYFSAFQSLCSGGMSSSQNGVCSI